VTYLAEPHNAFLRTIHTHIHTYVHITYQDYWKHATSSSSCKDPDTGDSFSWAALAAFEPIDIRVKDATLTNESRHQEEARLLQEAAEEIVKRIQSRFHRGDHIQNILQQSYSHWRKAALFDSFQSNINNPEELKRETLALFDSIDLNKDSSIRKDELLKAFLHLDEKTADLLIKEVDTDEDGGIAFDELWKMVESLAAASACEHDLKISRSRSFNSERLNG